MTRKKRWPLAVLLAFIFCFYAAPVALAQMGGHHDGGSTTGGHDGGVSNGGAGNHNGGNVTGRHHRNNHSGHDHGSLVNGMNRFSAKGVVVIAPTADPVDATVPLTMTANLQKANKPLKALIGQDVDFIISPDVFVGIAGVGPGTTDDILDGDQVKLMGNVVTSTDGTTMQYEITQMVVY